MDVVWKTKEYLLIFWIIIKISAAVRYGVIPNTRPASDEEILLAQLFDGYNPAARPVINSSKSVDVKMMFSLLQIQELNLKRQVLTSTAFIIFEWYDERLRWDEAEIPLKDVVIEARNLWRPEFASINGADDLYGDYGQFRTIIKSDGQVHWEPGGVFKTVCEIDITFYPFDEQHCKLIFGAWSYHTTKMNLSNFVDTVNMDSYEENGEWEIYNTTASRHEFFFDSTPDERFANIVFNLFLRRRYTFYIMNVILPSLMTSVLLLSIFFCTPAQKVQIGVVVLLSFRIFLLNVTDSIPKTSDNIPILGIYLTCTMAITTLSMVLTVFVLNLHHITDRPVPRWLKKFVLVFLAKLMCMCHYDQYAIDYEEERQENKNKYRVMPNKHLGKIIGSQVGLLTGLNGAIGATAEQKQDTQDSNKRGSTHRHAKQYRNRYSLTDEELGEKQRKADKKKLEEEYSRDWKHVAEVMDRLFFWLFLSAILSTTLLLFHPLTKAYFTHITSGK